jgi:hypothetical protein
MILAVAALMFSAAGATPNPAASASAANDASNASTASADNSALFSGTSHDTNAAITVASEDGIARLDTSKINFDRNGGPVMTASLVNRETLLEEARSSTFSNEVLPDPEPSREHRVTPAVSTPARRAWLALAFAEHGAAAFDAYSTRISIGHGNVEDDPLMRPFAHSPAIYLATQVTPVLFDLLARHMQRSEYGMLRRTWWLPQSLSTGISIMSGVHNLNLVATEH